MKVSKNKKILQVVIILNIIFCLISLFDIIAAQTWFPKLKFTSEQAVLVLSILTILAACIFLLWILKSKYPDKYLTQTIIGFTYTFSVFNLISCLVIIFMGISFASVIHKTNLSILKEIYRMWLIESVSLFLLTATSISLVILSFKIIKEIQQNYFQTLKNQISSIGNNQI